jgi:hypothetical protein
MAIAVPIQQRFHSAHARLCGAVPRVALAVIPSPEYDVPVFNLCSAELAGYLRYQNPDVTHIDFLEPDILFSRTDQLEHAPEWIVEQLNSTRPHVIGLSAKIGSTHNLIATLELLALEHWAAEAVIVVGNVLSTFSHDQLADRFPHVLFAVGDGEIALDRIYKAVRSGSADIADIPNLVYRKADGALHTTRKELLVHAEQHWLPAFDSLELTRRKQGDIVIRATTGCSAHCTFCSIRELNLFSDGRGVTRKAGWRSYPPERTAAQLRFLESQGVLRVNFADDEFGNVDFDFLDRLSDLLIEQNNQVRFNVSMRLDAFWTPSMPAQEHERRKTVLRKLTRAGLDSIFAGAESGSPSQLKRYGKGYPVEVNRHSLDFLLRENVKVHVGYIPFDQFVNRYEVAENLAFLETPVGPGPLYRYVTSPINVMRVQRGTPYEGLMRRAGLLGDLEANLSFYESRFVDPRMEAIATLARDWYTEIQDLRYPLSQLRRYAENNPLFVVGGAERSEELLDRMHQLDIELVRALLAVFPEDEFDHKFRGTPAFLQKHPELPAATDKWRIDLRQSELKLQSVLTQFRARLEPLAAEMRSFLLCAYGRERTSAAA